ncbi:phospholipase A2, membrane associated-like [Lepus europaeus]|uniref:phospholipase A2, membrane associated-like n=1 Tax=Lepus europaeus TaxID=9983 RepID=UPI002B464EC7|nr:phospholipase A2, membrane associated-like [Lepus europaeus]
MKTLLLLAVIMAVGLLQVHSDMIQFSKMIKYMTGKNALVNYNGYGCHCGLGGKGEPKDATDRCCVVHDCCYERLKNMKCGTKLLNYTYSMSGGKITCAKQDRCRSQLCECDKAAAYCFAQHKNTYNIKLRNYSNLRCTGSKPSC